MRSLKRLRPSPAMIVAIVALFVALSGAAYAGFSLPNNSVRSANIVNGQVKTGDLGTFAVTPIKIQNSAIKTNKLRDNAVTTPKILDGAVTSAKVLDGAVTSAKVLDGTLQTTDLTPAAQAELKAIGAITVQREDLALPDASTTGIQVACPAGTRIIGGGSSVDQSSSDDIHLTVSRPFNTTPTATLTDPPSDGNTFDAWRVVYRNPTGGTGAATARVFAICVQG